MRVVEPNADLATLHMLGAPYDETYSVAPPLPGHPPTMSHALTPLLAFEALGGAKHSNFSWILVGDDDTVWSLPAVLRLLNERGLRAEDPHLISDYQYHCVQEQHGCSGPVAVDPRCAPCPPGVAYCPCRLPPGCTQRGWNYSACPNKLRVAPYGGAGVIFSRGMLLLLTRDPHHYLPLAMDTVVPEAPAGDVVLADAPRLLGYGFTRLQPAAEAAGSPAPRPGRRFFASHCQFNDLRSPQTHFQDLKALAASDPAAFRTMVSVHVRQRYGDQYYNLMRDYLPPYRRLVELLLRVEEREEAKRKAAAGPGQGTRDDHGRGGTAPPTSKASVARG
ncbi:hypothetical protein HXX76_007683 [Chlamydomonas incerta]|uniref:Hexosyltransferase n=1 Tax=Chlamydomonas incerta TaxID=51695 RepID=A0A835SX89_CHLIN|nr:hypothetical protein HXX76_007683 [Chlamydomonas incerta]|eukprot:KAG2434798.1 hypothetical protein HXX76_007683 [Chlamydomonas incerta]